MPTKTIKTTVAVHKPGEGHEPFKYDGGSRVSGTYVADVVLPGDAVTLDAAEADRILKRFGGSVVTAEGDKEVGVAQIAPPKVSTDPGKPAAAAKP